MRDFSTSCISNRYKKQEVEKQKRINYEMREK